MKPGIGNSFANSTSRVVKKKKKNRTIKMLNYKFVQKSMKIITKNNCQYRTMFSGALGF